VYGTLANCPAWVEVRRKLLDKWGPLPEAVTTWIPTSTQAWNKVQIFWRFLLPTDLVDKLLKLKFRMGMVKRYYLEFVKAGSALISTLANQPLPLDPATFELSKCRLNPFEWPEDAPDPMAHE